MRPARFLPVAIADHIVQKNRRAHAGQHSAASLPCRPESPAMTVWTEDPGQSSLEIGRHYAETLKQWHDNFKREWNRIEGEGFDDRFFRASSCRMGFAASEPACRAIATVRRPLFPKRLQTQLIKVIKRILFEV